MSDDMNSPINAHRKPIWTPQSSFKSNLDKGFVKLSSVLVYSTFSYSKNIREISFNFTWTASFNLWIFSCNIFDFFMASTRTVHFLANERTFYIFVRIKYLALKLQHVIFWLWWLARGVWPSSSSLASPGIRSFGYSVLQYRCLHLVHIKLNEEMDVLRIMGGASKSIPTDTTFFSLQFDFFKILEHFWDGGRL